MESVEAIARDMSESGDNNAEYSEIARERDLTVLLCRFSATALNLKLLRLRYSVYRGKHPPMALLSIDFAPPLVQNRETLKIPHFLQEQGAKLDVRYWQEKNLVARLYHF